MGRMQCLESAVSKPALWSISSTPLHSRPKQDAYNLKVQCHDLRMHANALQTLISHRLSVCCVTDTVMPKQASSPKLS